MISVSPQSLVIRRELGAASTYLFRHALRRDFAFLGDSSFASVFLTRGHLRIARAHRLHVFLNPLGRQQRFDASISARRISSSRAVSLACFKIHSLSNRSSTGSPSVRRRPLALGFFFVCDVVRRWTIAMTQDGRRQPRDVDRFRFEFPIPRFLRCCALLAVDAQPRDVRLGRRAEDLGWRRRASSW